MATRRRTSESDKPRRPPAKTPEGRENQMISYAVDLAEKQMIEGTASSQLITHYVKLGSSREKLEQERLVRENDLLRVKAETIESQKRTEELYGKALNAMRRYAGQEPETDEYDEERR